MAAAGDDDSRRYAARISLTNKQQATTERRKEGEDEEARELRVTRIEPWRDITPRNLNAARELSDALSPLLFAPCALRLSPLSPFCRARGMCVCVCARVCVYRTSRIVHRHRVSRDRHRPCRSLLDGGSALCCALHRRPMGIPHHPIPHTEKRRTRIGGERRRGSGVAIDRESMRVPSIM